MSKCEICGKTILYCNKCSKVAMKRYDIKTTFIHKWICPNCNKEVNTNRRTTSVNKEVLTSCQHCYKIYKVFVERPKILSDNAFKEIIRKELVREVEELKENE